VSLTIPDATPDIREHTRAVIAKLETRPILLGSTFSGVVPSRPNRYCVVEVQRKYTQHRFTGGQAAQDYTVVVKGVGSTTDQAQMVSVEAARALLGAVLTVTGRKCHSLHQTDAQPPEIDSDITPPVWYSVDVYDFRSEPA
jgi:hypothetical protein